MQYILKNKRLLQINSVQIKSNAMQKKKKKTVKKYKQQNPFQSFHYFNKQPFK